MATNGVGTPVESPLRSLRPKDSSITPEHAELQGEGINRNTAERLEELSALAAEAIPSTPFGISHEQAFKSADVQSTGKQKNSARIPKRLFNATKDHVINHENPSRDINGNAAGPAPTTKASMSWAEASGQSPRHAAEYSPQLWPAGHDEPFVKEEDSLDGWQYSRRESREKQSHISPTLEGWDYLISIPQEQIEQLAMLHRPPHSTSGKVIRYEDGQNNLVAIVQFDNDVKYCVRMPSCGSRGVWNKHARSTLLNVVDTMRYVKATTNLLIPDVVAYDVGFENAIKAPFIITSFVEGRRLSDVWWDADGTEPGQDFVSVPRELEAKRQKILRSIANQVVELRSLKFKSYGEFRLVNGDVRRPTVVPIKMRPFSSILEDDILDRHARRFPYLMLDETYKVSTTSSISSLKSFTGSGTATSSYEYYNELLRTWYETTVRTFAKYDVFDRPDENPMVNKTRGIFALYSLLLKYLPYAPGTSESYQQNEEFVLAQTDFNPQNIFVDREGNVTGFIDWDYTDTKAPYLGWARQPVFLCEDWAVWKTGQNVSGALSWPSRTGPVTCELERYRKDYARYLIEACAHDSDDWRFVLKTPLFDAVVSSIGGIRYMETLLVRVLSTHVGHYDWISHFLDVGQRGFKPGVQSFYENLFKRVLDCDPLAVKAELGIMDVSKELRTLRLYVKEHCKTHETLYKAQKERVEMCKRQLELVKKQNTLLQKTLAQGLHDMQPNAARQDDPSAHSLDDSQASEPVEKLRQTPNHLSVDQTLPNPHQSTEQSSPTSNRIDDPHHAAWNRGRSENYFVMSGALQPTTLLDCLGSSCGSLHFERPRTPPHPSHTHYRRRWKRFIEELRSRFKKF
ncbi:uncharacterized protein PV09_06365 [Verruconis gallopava]|uniref:Aminoglycoside phosphotransferase domain-containing protein n=1 Tax=Verruconis gallopava TaxID=253628 RepID=A0A0D2ASR6_9PEZI|nr:uncharacterized protein PV09_06365 [Verruconis gallopava]KIW02209.1 hypothetical protein PV09_06365 [Verruconis gallopava]